jgi:DNA-binding response OmpR family regulator
MRVLMVNDSTDLAELVGLMVCERGFEFDAVFTAEAALDAAVRLSPDLILVDWYIGDAVGDYVIRLLRAGYSHEVPILAISSAMGVEALARQAGADDFLAKPFTEHMLMSKLDELLSGRPVLQMG